MFTGCLVGAFRKTADQLFKHQTHVVVIYRFWGEIHVGKGANHLVEQVGIFQQVDAGIEVEVLEDLTSILGEGPHVGIQVITHMGFTQLGQLQRRAVVESVAAGIEQQLLFGQLRHGLGCIHHGQHLGLAK